MFATDEPTIDTKHEAEAPGADALHGLFYRASRHYKEFCAMTAALRLGIFDALEEPLTLAGLCEACKVMPPATEHLVELFCELGLLHRQDGMYRNTPLSSLYLVTSSPLFQGAVMRDIQYGFSLWDRLDQVLRQGPIAVEEEAFFENGLVDSLAAEILCGELQKTVEAVSAVPAFQQARSLLDLGGGHGLYAIALSQMNPELKATVFDFPDIARKAEEVMAAHGAHRVRFVPGNLFTDDLGSDHDVIFLSYNPGGKNPALLKRIHDALKPGGLFVTKHVYYKKGEGSKDRLLDLEWSLSAFNGVSKDSNIYRFSGDLSWEAHRDLLERHFTIEQILEADAFSGHPLAKFGDRMDSKMIVAVKKRQVS
ncbi:methyltransferase [Desulfoluna spongiiphila]|uniref:methyltransferase n=1 Tax=Desulfoluna spongiiphila TaxID=419481 RepID=UPI001254AC32|nr:methyltransferase [Desulfoluna spongiiphila]VVS95591.1 o-methyltransferase comt-type [Desulfoluna spongiiphila]